jgi:hypothetical protein
MRNGGTHSLYAYVCLELKIITAWRYDYSIGQKKSAMAKKLFGFSAIFSSALQCCF